MLTDSFDVVVDVCRPSGANRDINETIVEVLKEIKWLGLLFATYRNKMKIMIWFIM